MVQQNDVAFKCCILQNRSEKVNREILLASQSMINRDRSLYY